MVFYTVLILVFFTYISEAYSSVSWLDHVVCTGTSNRKMLSCSILDDLAFSYHIPLKIIYSYSCDADINSVPPNKMHDSRYKKLYFTLVCVQKH